MKPIVLITGATGFIGRNLIESFLHDDRYSLLALTSKKDSSGQALLNKYKIPWITSENFDSFEGNIDYCIHLASYGVAYGDRDLNTMIDVNIGLSEKVMRFVSNHSCKLFVNTGSCFEYGTGIANRLITEEDSLNPEDIYAATKVACEDVLKVYSNLLGIKMITIRPFSIYGRYENSQRIMPLVFHSGLTHTPLLLTKGEQIRDYLNVQDVAKSIHSLVVNEQKLQNHESINICSGYPISLKEFITEIIKACGFDYSLFHFGAKEYRKNESMFFAGNNARLLSYIGERDLRLKSDTIVHIFDEYCKGW